MQAPAEMDTNQGNVTTSPPAAQQYIDWAGVGPRAVAGPQVLA
jgi:hypothetical protein